MKFQAITLPSTKSRVILAEILYATIKRAARVVSNGFIYLVLTYNIQTIFFNSCIKGLKKVILLSESPSVLKIVHSLMGTKLLLLGSIPEVKETLKSLKFTRSSVLHSASMKIQRKTTK